MKKVSTIITILLSVFFTYSCGSDSDWEEEVIEQGKSKMKTISLTANSGEGNRTKVGHSDDEGTVNLIWTAGDQLTVEAVSEESVYTYTTFTLSSGEDTTTGVFTGEVPENAVSVNVYYPTAITGGVDFSTQRQTANGSLDHLSNYDIMAAMDITIDETNSATFGLTHKCVLFTIPVTNNVSEEQTIIGITLSNRKDASVQSVFAKNVILNNGVLSATNTASLTLGVDNGAVVAGATYTAYMMVYMENSAVLDTKELDVIVHTNAGRNTTTKTAIEFSAGSRYTIKNVELKDENFEDALYLVGGATIASYDLGKALAMTNNNDGTYTWSGPLMANDFKLVGQNSDWGDVIFQLQNGSDNSIVVNDYADSKFAASEEGFYTVTVDFKTMSINYTKTASFALVFPIGDATPYGWTIGNQYFTDVNNDASVVKGTLTLSAGKMKFLREPSFSGLTIHPIADNQNLLGTQTIEVRETGDTDYQWNVSPADAGTYDITIDLINNTIQFERKGVTLPPYGNGEF